MYYTVYQVLDLQRMAVKNSDVPTHVQQQSVNVRSDEVQSGQEDC